jgi:hypothetical protein
MDFEISIAGMDCKEEVSLFLENAGKNSVGTRDTYYCAISKLNAYAGLIKTRLLEFTPVHADGFVFHLMGGGYSPASVRLAVLAASGLCEFIERRHSDASPEAGGSRLFNVELRFKVRRFSLVDFRRQDVLLFYKREIFFG